MREMNAPEFSKKQKNEIILDILETLPGGSFLEVGLGMTAHRKRHEVINDLGIHYTGIDFEDVCQRHMGQLQNWGLNQNSRTIGNHRDGSYLFNLIDILRAGEKFDFIYFDGHHTINVDAAPILVCGLLTKKSGFLSLDDYNWSLTAQKSNIEAMPHYDGVYNFSEYTEAQQSKPHIRIIAEALLGPLFDLTPQMQFSTPEWRTFRVS